MNMSATLIKHVAKFKHCSLSKIVQEHVYMLQLTALTLKSKDRDESAAFNRNRTEKCQ